MGCHLEIKMYLFNVLRSIYSFFVALFDGVCDQTKELQILSGSMSDDNKWIISSSGRYMFVRFAVQSWGINIGFNAKIHYGKGIP